MLAQYDRGGIPAGIPLARVANKTGGIEGFAGDTAIVGPFERSPLLIVVLLSGIPSNAIANATIRQVSQDVYRRYGPK